MLTGFVVMTVCACQFLEWIKVHIKRLQNKKIPSDIMESNIIGISTLTVTFHSYHAVQSYRGVDYCRVDS